MFLNVTTRNSVSEKSLETSPFYYVFERSPFCSPKLHLFDQRCNRNSNIV